MLKLNSTAHLLVVEMLRLKTEANQPCMDASILLNALYSTRRGNDFSNLFYIYFEKNLGIPAKEIESVFDKLLGEKKGDVSTQKVTFCYDSEKEEEGEKTSNSIEVEVDTEVYEVCNYLEKFMSIHGCKVVDPNYFVVALFQTDSAILRRFIKEISANYMDAKFFFDAQKILGYEIVPYELSSFVTYMNPKAKGKECDIIGRNKELNEIYRIMLKSSKRNVILYGDPGVGKTAIAEKLISHVANGICNKKFLNFKIFEMSIKDFIITSKDQNDANVKMNKLLEFLSSNSDNIILVIDEIHIILGKGGLFDPNKMDLSSTLKPILSRGDVRILGITTTLDYVAYFESNDALNRRFEGIKVKEPKINQVPEIIAPRIKKMQIKNGITITEELLEKAVWYAECFEFYKNNPDKSIDTVDRAMSNAVMQDRNFVTEQDLLDVYKISFKIWNGMSKAVKKATAYHETGHYVVHRLTNPGNLITLAVSIYPTDDYLGINILDYDEEVTPVTNRKYYISAIAASLAGRIAEEMVCGEVNSGSASDLDAATETAKEMITELGMSSGVGKNRVYDSDEIYGNDQGSKEIDDEINEIIDEAYVFCQKLLEKNRDLLDAIANALLENHIMKKSELDEVWDATIAKRKKEETPKKKKFSVKVSVEGLPSKREVKVELKKAKNVVATKARELRRKVRKIKKN